MKRINKTKQIEKMQSANVLPKPCEQTNEHTNKNGKKKVKEKEQKVFDLQVHCICKRKCAERIDVLKQQEIFQKFNEANDWPSQTRFLRALISCRSTAENLNPINTAKKENIYTYHFFDESGSLAPVCLSFFTKVLQVERTKVFRAVDTLKSNPNAIEKRGSSTNRRTNALDLKNAKDFISSFVVYESSRNPKKSHGKFVHPRLSLRKMYLLYSQQCAFRSQKVLADTKFRAVFNELGRKIVRSQPKCLICKEKKNDSENERELESSAHVDIVRGIKNDLISLVEDVRRMPAEKTEIFTFKLHCAIDLPHISDDDVFFKQQLWCCILTVYDEVRDITYFYVWNETIAQRGSTEIVSCLFKHFMAHLPTDTRKIVLFSDPNGTRNLKTSLMLQKFFNYCNRDALNVIEQHFFSPDHCYCSCDRSFQTVQSNIKLNNIFDQENLIDAIKNAKKNDPKFVVTAMSRKNFVSAQNLEKLLVDSKNSQPIEWLEYQKIFYKRKQQLSMDVVKYGDTSTKSITLSAICTPGVFSAAHLNYSYLNEINISKSKYDDLQAILKHIPEAHHEYYRSLSYDHNDLNKVDYALVDHWLSDEE